MYKLKGLKPDRVFYYFEEISRIPRCSYKEKEVSDYLKDIGQKLGLETIQDENMNILIRKPASKGYEDSPGVIIQGHMDMVCEKEEFSNHDFKKDSIDLMVDKDYIRANNTTLGADNGIAVAMGLAILEDNSLEHPNLEFLVTTAEEVGMLGAIGLPDDLLIGRRLLNIDSEEEGVLTIGSAGGELVDIRFVAKHQRVDNLIEFSIELGGLIGGHSGMEIDRGRLNAHKLLTEVLRKLKDSMDYYLISFKGGSKDNAIPRMSVANIAVNEELIPAFKNKLEAIKKYMIKEYKEKEANLYIEVLEEGSVSEVLKDDTLNSLLGILEMIPTGVYRRFKKDESIVESSSNLAIVNLDKERFIIQTSLRSLNQGAMLNLKENIISVALKHRAEYNLSNEYPEWSFREQSELRDVATEVYEKISGKQMKTTVLHAGLETGVFSRKYPDIDIVSFGPNIEDVHTPEEKLDISSTVRTFEYLKELLKTLK